MPNIKLTKKMKTVIVCVLALACVLIYFLPDASSKSENVNINNSAGEKTSETRLEEVLSNIRGAGSVKVMIEYAKSDKNLFNDETDGNSLVKGVIVVAQGADDIGVRLELMKAVETVLQIEKNQVEIFTMN